MSHTKTGGRCFLSLCRMVISPHSHLSLCLSVNVAQSQFHSDDELLMLALIMQPGSDVRPVLFVKLNVMMRDMRMMMLMM